MNIWVMWGGGGGRTGGALRCGPGLRLLPLAREAHLGHVVVVFQIVLQLLAHRAHVAQQPLVPCLQPPQVLQRARSNLPGGP